MPAYLDWNATTPLAGEALEAMNAARATAWANPASIHGAGRAARAELEHAREAVGQALGVDARDVVFTAGGTEANNLALTAGVGEGAIVVSAIEHPSVLRAAEALRASHKDVRVVPVSPSGKIEPEAIAATLAAVDGPVRLVSLMAANHETGILQPIAEAAAMAHARGALFHTDAVQALGKVAIPGLEEADLVSVAAHKIRGPKGIGALGTRCGTKVGAVLVGGSQERGIRPGTQDATLAAGFRAALRRAAGGPGRYATLSALRDRLEQAAVARGAIVNGEGPRLPHVTNVSFLRWSGDELLAALDLEGVFVSSGAACSAGTLEPSPIIRAMAGEARAASAIRISIGDDTTEDEVAFAIDRLDAVLARR